MRLVCFILFVLFGFTQSETCDEVDTFKCSDNPLVCIPNFWFCDGEADCANGADELTCNEVSCTSQEFECASGECIPEDARCDSKTDCSDGSDEMDCPKESDIKSCSDYMFQCGNGNCIVSLWVCDGEPDCEDNSDEMNCGVSTTKSPIETTVGSSNMTKGTGGTTHYQKTTTMIPTEKEKSTTEFSPAGGEAECKETEFRCDNGRCIWRSMICDGFPDCLNEEDEHNCTAETDEVTACPEHFFQCGNGMCITSRWVCDGEADCEDSSDETNCDTTTSTTEFTPTEPGEVECKETEFRCNNGRCIWDTWVCDGFPDCLNEDDELNCTESSTRGYSTTTTSTTIQPDDINGTESSYCSPDYFLCGFGGCLPYHWRCDGKLDCIDHSDEKNCEESVCPEGYFRCDSGRCIWNTWVCDGSEHCPNGTDEIYCPRISTTQAPTSETESVSLTTESTTTCKETDFQCNSGSCIPKPWSCDGQADCEGGEDEENCVEARCGENYFQCGSGRCIYKHWVCDGDRDCKDGDDEVDCEKQTCSSDQIRCPSGDCISKKWKCDGEADCKSGFDEQGCEPKIDECPNEHFRCPNDTCIPERWRCDGDRDCLDNFDEADCESSPVYNASETSEMTTEDYTRPTTTNYKEEVDTTEPIYIPFDSMGPEKPETTTSVVDLPSTTTPEIKITTTATASENPEVEAATEPIYMPFDSMGNDNPVEVTKSPRAFEISPTPAPPSSRRPLYPCLKNFVQCDFIRCLPTHKICDGVNDCLDGTDEVNCEKLNCAEGMHYCSPKNQCLPDSVLCNRMADCPDLSDERNCGKRNCTHHEFQCLVTKHCIFDRWVCDGENDCLDNSDELNCNLAGRSSDDFDCEDGTFIPMSFRCDGAYDCYNGIDEASCAIASEEDTTTNTEECPSLDDFLSAERDCPVGFKNFGGYCILIDAYPRSWLHSQDICRNRTSRIASFQSDCVYQKFLADYLKEKGLSNWNYWIGEPAELKTTEKIAVKAMKVPVWFIGGEKCEESKEDNDDRQCFYIDHEESNLYLSTNCDEYAGVICQYD